MNIISIISLQNLNILSPKQCLFECNCTVRNECPLNGECQTPSVICCVDLVTNTNDEEKIYFGLLRFKERYNNHNSDFKLKGMKTVQN